MHVIDFRSVLDLRQLFYFIYFILFYFILFYYFHAHLVLSGMHSTPKLEKLLPVDHLNVYVYQQLQRRYYYISVRS